jgi:hypothetical protein
MEAAPATTATSRVYSIARDISLKPGWRVSSVTTNKQAGDVWSSIVLIVEENR